MVVRDTSDLNLRFKLYFFNAKTKNNKKRILGGKGKIIRTEHVV